MRLAPEADHALANLIQRGLFERRIENAQVVETSNDGYAAVTLVLPPDAVCIQWKIERLPFNFLRDAGKAADGALLVFRGDGSVEAHVMECKRTITLKTWGDAKIQMRWSLARLRALAGVLGMRVAHACCYTAYREAPLDSDPGILKLMLGDDPDARDFRAQFDWTDERIDIGKFPDRWPHRKVVLDGNGEGTIRIDV